MFTPLCHRRRMRNARKPRCVKFGYCSRSTAAFRLCRTSLTVNSRPFALLAFLAQPAKRRLQPGVNRVAERLAGLDAGVLHFADVPLHIAAAQLRGFGLSHAGQSEVFGKIGGIGLMQDALPAVLALVFFFPLRVTNLRDDLLKFRFLGDEPLDALLGLGRDQLGVEGTRDLRIQPQRRCRAA